MKLWAGCQPLGWAAPGAPRDVGSTCLYRLGDVTEKPAWLLQAAFTGLAGSPLGSNGTGSSVLWSLWVPLNPV